VLCRNLWANKDERINEWIAQDLDENGRLAIVSAIGPLFLVNDRLWQRDNEPYRVPLTVDRWPDLTWPDVILLQGSITTSEDQPQDQWCGRMRMRMLRDLINRQRRADGYSWVNNITTTDCYCLRIHVRARCLSTTDDRRSNFNIHSVCRWLVLRCRSSCAQKPPSTVRSLRSSAINYSYYTVSQKTPQIWNGMARNYIERFWWRLAEIFKRLWNRVWCFSYHVGWISSHTVSKLLRVVFWDTV